MTCNPLSVVTDCSFSLGKFYLQRSCTKCIFWLWCVFSRNIWSLYGVCKSSLVIFLVLFKWYPSIFTWYFLHFKLSYSFGSHGWYFSWQCWNVKLKLVKAVFCFSTYYPFRLNLVWMFCSVSYIINNICHMSWMLNNFMLRGISGASFPALREPRCWHFLGPAKARGVGEQVVVVREEACCQPGK